VDELRTSDEGASNVNPRVGNLVILFLRPVLDFFYDRNDPYKISKKIFLHSLTSSGRSKFTVHVRKEAFTRRVVGVIFAIYTSGRRKKLVRKLQIKKTYILSNIECRFYLYFEMT
jgi:hypothetical protein